MKVRTAFDNDKIETGIHSHVNTKDVKSEIRSMDGDKNRKSRGIFPFNYYAYMKNSGNLYYIDQWGQERHVKTINTSKAVYRKENILKIEKGIYRLYWINPKTLQFDLQQEKTPKFKR